jgi:hypothetical protein
MKDGVSYLILVVSHGFSLMAGLAEMLQIKGVPVDVQGGAQYFKVTADPVDSLAQFQYGLVLLKTTMFERENRIALVEQSHFDSFIRARGVRGLASSGTPLHKRKPSVIAIRPDTALQASAPPARCGEGCTMDLPHFSSFSQNASFDPRNSEQSSSIRWAYGLLHLAS